MQKMITHPKIAVKLNKKFNPAIDTAGFDHVFYTGPLDAFFNYQFGRLGYRTVSFKKDYADGDYQGTVQINYCDETVPYTRITEHKHFTPWEKHIKTVYFTEYSKETEVGDVPYYPKRLESDITLLLKYRMLAEKQQQVSFLGRLATYRYMDMHHVIGEAMGYAKQFTNSVKNNQPVPVFANTENYDK
jgi:UDP-galactopyranose mutase